MSASTASRACSDTLHPVASTAASWLARLLTGVTALFGLTGPPATGYVIHANTADDRCSDGQLFGNPAADGNFAVGAYTESARFMPESVAAPGRPFSHNDMRGRGIWRTGIIRAPPESPEVREIWDVRRRPCRPHGGGRETPLPGSRVHPVPPPVR